MCCNVSKNNNKKIIIIIAYNHYPPGFCLCHQGSYKWNHLLFFRIINEWNLIMKTLIFFFLRGFVINNLSLLNIEFISPLFFLVLCLCHTSYLIYIVKEITVILLLIAIFSFPIKTFFNWILNKCP